MCSLLREPFTSSTTITSYDSIILLWCSLADAGPALFSGLSLSRHSPAACFLFFIHFSLSLLPTSLYRCSLLVYCSARPPWVGPGQGGIRGFRVHVCFVSCFLFVHCRLFCEVNLGRLHVYIGSVSASSYFSASASAFYLLLFDSFYLLFSFSSQPLSGSRIPHEAVSYIYSPSLLLLHSTLHTEQSSFYIYTK